MLLVVVVIGVAAPAPFAYATFSTGDKLGSAGAGYSHNYKLHFGKLRFGSNSGGGSYGHSHYVAHPRKFTDELWSRHSTGWGVAPHDGNGGGKKLVLQLTSNDDAHIEVQFGYRRFAGSQHAKAGAGSLAGSASNEQEQDHSDWFDKGWTGPKTALKYIGASGALIYVEHGETHASPYKLAEFDWRQYCREHGEQCVGEEGSMQGPLLATAVVMALAGIGLALLLLAARRRRRVK
ncbi:MAG: hypothetical protein GKR94_25470 [Gammaproteobacteria bacterium]|nr:hypothetical protein [Gammaproteobacteria bacterium]